MMYEEERKAVIAAALDMQARGMIKGTSGNVSLRTPEADLIAITPSSIPYEDLKPEDICLLTLEGEWVDSEKKPSSEHPMHLAIYKARPDVMAVVHTHSKYATIMASLCGVLPAVTIPGAEFYPVYSVQFVLPGTEKLAKAVVSVLGPHDAVMLEHHGLVCTAKSLEKALDEAEYIEENAEIAYRLHAARCYREMASWEAETIRDNFKKGLAQ